MDWVTTAADLRQGWLEVGDFADPASIKRLADPSPDNRSFREKILGAVPRPSTTPPTPSGASWLRRSPT